MHGRAMGMKACDVSVCQLLLIWISNRRFLFTFAPARAISFRRLNYAKLRQTVSLETALQIAKVVTTFEHFRLLSV